MFHLNRGFVVLLNDFEWPAFLLENVERAEVIVRDRPMLLITLDFRIIDFTTNKTLCVEDGVFGVGVEGILCAVTNTVKSGRMR